MMSLAFIYRFVHTRWKQIIDVVFKRKKRVVQKIYLLRTIGILEADFNMALKIPFSKKLIQCAKANGCLHDE